MFLIELCIGEVGWIMWKGIKRNFAQDILAQGCSLVEWILVLEAMMQCTYEMTLQGS